jgi:hypothetical protein
MRPFVAEVTQKSRKPRKEDNDNILHMHKSERLLHFKVGKLVPQLPAPEFLGTPFDFFPQTQTDEPMFLLGAESGKKAICMLHATSRAPKHVAAQSLGPQANV